MWVGKYRFLNGIWVVPVKFDKRRMKYTRMRISDSSPEEEIQLTISFTRLEFIVFEKNSTASSSTPSNRSRQEYPYHNWSAKPEMGEWFQMDLEFNENRASCTA